MSRRFARPVPIPAVILPPPAAVRCGPDPFVVGVRPLTALCRDDGWSSLGGSTNGHQHKSVPVAGGHNSIANDEARIVDRFRNRKDLEAARRKIGDRVEISDLAIRGKECVDRTIARCREANNLSHGVAAERAVLISRCGIDHPYAAERSEIVHCAIRIEKGMRRTVGRERKAANLSGGIDGIGRASGPAKCSQIDRVVGELRHRVGQCDEKNQQCRARDFRFWVHEKESPLVREVIYKYR